MTEEIPIKDAELEIVHDMMEDYDLTPENTLADLIEAIENFDEE